MVVKPKKEKKQRVTSAYPRFKERDFNIRERNDRKKNKQNKLYVRSVDKDKK